MIIDVWAVYQGDDDRSIGTPTYFFSKRLEAEQFAQDKGWYGGKAPIKKRHAVSDSGKYYLIDEIVNESGVIDIDQCQEKYDATIRAEALSKLTAEEKRVLGV